MIAISYRREDSVAVAGRLYDRLQSKFGHRNVFMDFDSIPAGVDFREHITSAIERAHVVIALIGPQWMGERAGFRRIDDPDDFVRFEISSALARGIPIIPVLVNDAEMPEAEELPADVREIAFRNALPLDSGRDFHSHAERLVSALRSIPPGAHQTRPVWRHPGLLLASTLAVAIAISAVVLIIVGLFRGNSDVTAKHKRPETSEQPSAISPTSASPPTVKLENVPVLTPPTPDPSASVVPIREFRGGWANSNTSPFGGNGTLTVADQLLVDEKEIHETITTEWVSEGTPIFRITLKVRFGELWAIKNQLNARCLSADVVDVADPKEFGKFANMREQTANAAKAGVNLGLHMDAQWNRTSTRRDDLVTTEIGGTALHEQIAPERGGFQGGVGYSVRGEFT